MDKMVFDAIIERRLQKKGYKAIAKEMNISRDTVRYVCQQNNLAGYINGKPNPRIITPRKCKRCGCEINEPRRRICGICREAETPRRECKDVTCAKCGKVFHQKQVFQKYCSYECKQPLAVHLAKHCSTCGTLFVPVNNKQKFCRRQCGKKWRGIGRRYTSRRDERLKQAVEYNKAVNLHTLIKRDNNTCWICKKQCDLYDYEVTATGAMLCGDKYPTMDHVIPCSEGGSHTWDNVRLACLKCNREKSNSMTKEEKDGQLCLIV